MRPRNYNLLDYSDVTSRRVHRRNVTSIDPGSSVPVQTGVPSYERA